MALRRVARALALVLLGSWLGTAAVYFLDPRPLRVPVAGVAPARVASTFGAPRGGGRRRHQGSDIFARRGTPVRAAASGVVVRVSTLPLGGKTVHTLGRRGVLCYYAHLDRWADGLHVGQAVTEDTVLGYVGNTGNARTTPPHLHFETRPLWRGLTPVDPVTLLR